MPGLSLNRLSLKRSRWAAGLLAAAFGSPVAPAQTDTPILRIETGQHGGAITDIAIDRTRGLVLTGSDDKTLRVWSLGHGDLLRVMRAPIGDQDVGQIFAARPAPSGRTYLAGGNTLGPGGGAIWAFAGDGLTFVGGFGALPGPLQRLDYRRDSQAVAAVFGGPTGARGVRVFGADTREVFADETFAEAPIWTEFARDDRLVAASSDGEIRIYGRQGDTYTPLARFAAPGGQPYHVRFSPDGARLAIGYLNAKRVDVVASGDGALIRSLEALDLAGQALGAVAWIDTSQGPALAAAGSAQDAQGRTIARVWSAQSFETLYDAALNEDSITRLEAAPGGGFVFAGSDARWGRVAGNGATLFMRGGAVADFRFAQDRGFSVSADASEVTIAPGRTADPIRFDLARRVLRKGEDSGAEAVFAAPPAWLRNWRNSNAVSINGRPVRLDAGERVLSADAADRRGGVLLGSDWRLYWYGSSGGEIASVPTPAPVWAVVTADDADMAVAALGDGTIRWYDLNSPTPLEERAAVFIDQRRETWAAWTPEGFFAASATGGKDLVGYHRNRGFRQPPEWIEFAQLSRLYYEPDIPWASVRGDRDRLSAVRAKLGADASDRIAQAEPPGLTLLDYCPLKTLDAEPDPATCAPLKRATRGFARIRDADEPAPATPACGVSAEPTRGFARIRETDDTSPQVATIPAECLPADAEALLVRFQADPRGGALGDVDVFVNGRNANRTTRGFQRVRPASPSPAETTPETLVRRVRLDPGENTVKLKVYNTAGLYAQSEDITFARTPRASAAPTAAQAPTQGPKLFVLAVGADVYQGFPELSYAVADARSFADLVQSRFDDSERGYAGVTVTQLFDASVTRDSVGKAVGSIAAQAGPNDAVLIYLAGHGVVHEDDQYYFVTPGAPDWDGLPEVSVSQSDLIQWLSEVPTQRAFLFLDTCHAGTVTIANVGKINEESGRYILAASSTVEEALDSYNDKNGVFAYSVIEGLEGNAAARGKVDALNLGLYVRDVMPEYAAEKRHSQTAEFQASGKLLDFRLTRPDP